MKIIINDFDLLIFGTKCRNNPEDLDLIVDNFLKSHKPVEEIYGGKFHHGDYLWRETVGYAELDKKLSDRNGKSIKIFIQECEK